MNRNEFIEYLTEDCSIFQDEANPLIFRNPMNGAYTRIPDDYDELKDLEMVHHVVLLGAAPPDHLEDLYYTYQEHWAKRRNA